MKELINLFISFFKIGLYTFGGGYAMIMMIDNEITKRRGWCKPREFLDYLTIAQSSFGPIAVNTAILIGYHVKGTKGGLVAALGSILPSFIILVIVAIFFNKIDDNQIVIDIFRGIRPAVIALILYPAYSFAKHIKRIEYPVAIAVAALIYLDMSPLWFIIISIAWGVYLATKKKGRRIKK